MRTVVTVRRLVVAAVVLVAVPASPRHWCGSAVNPGSGLTSPAFLTHTASHGAAVSARLVCKKPKDVCNRRSGKITGTLTLAGPNVDDISGTLTYKHGLVCGLSCEADTDSTGQPQTVACSYTCPSGSKVTQGAFTVQRDCSTTS
jgi:hypothetical protein